MYKLIAGNVLLSYCFACILQLDIELLQYIVLIFTIVFSITLIIKYVIDLTKIELSKRDTIILDLINENKRLNLKLLSPK